MNDAGAGAAGLVTLAVLLGLYFLPFIVAWARGKAEGTGGVFLVNLLLGWTLVGWFVAFIWACTGRTSSDLRREERRHAELLVAMKTGSGRQ